MTVKELLDQVNALRQHTFSNDQLLIWLNEVEGHIMMDVFLWPIQMVYSYKIADTAVGVNMGFLNGNAMTLTRDLGYAPGGEVTISGLTELAANIGGPYTIVAVSGDGTVMRFNDDTFSAAGEDVGSLSYNGNNCPLLVLPPHDKLYRQYLLAQIAFAQEEWDGYQNYMAMYNEFLGEYKRWFARNYRPADQKRWGAEYARRQLL